ncbi:CBS domain-containing protein [Acidisphaera rubrifaciens]|nr:CBS domain-containing protein [Acidisphaera rubrifaciens]
MTVRAVLKYKGGEITSVSPNATAREIAETMAGQRIGSVLVLADDGSVAGIVSERDVVKAVAAGPERLAEARAADMMTRHVIAASPETSVDEAMELMDSGYFRHLPVLENGRLVGIISIRDLVKYRIMQHESDLDSLKRYITRPS